MPARALMLMLVPSIWAIHQVQVLEGRRVVRQGQAENPSLGAASRDERAGHMKGEFCDMPRVTLVRWLGRLRQRLE